MARKSNAVQVYDIKSILARINMGVAEPKEIAYIGQLFKDFKTSEVFTALEIICRDGERSLKLGRSKPDWSAEYVLGKIEGVQYILNAIDSFIQLQYNIKEPREKDGKEELIIPGDE